MKRVLILMVASLTMLSCGEKPAEKTTSSVANSVVSSGKTITVPLAGLASGAKPLEMIEIPAGTFTMGSPSDERGRYSYKGKEFGWLPHKVTISQPFYLGRCEVTQAQWRAVMGNNPSADSAEAKAQDEKTYGVGDDYPAYYVSWDDCQAFIKRLNTMGLGTFRLPTEAEREYACRAGTTTRFSFGDALECVDEGDEFSKLADQYMWWRGNNTHRGNAEGSKQVGLKSANPWDLYDMHGNVCEWCLDWWEFPSARGPQVDPQGPATGSYRVSRGGFWSNDAQFCRSVSRFYRSPDYRNNYIGLRLLRSYP